MGHSHVILPPGFGTFRKNYDATGAFPQARFCDSDLPFLAVLVHVGRPRRWCLHCDPTIATLESPCHNECDRLRRPLAHTTRMHAGVMLILLSLDVM